MTPHFVEWAVDDKVPYGEWQIEYFRTREEASQKVSWAKKNDFAYLQGEVGVYKTKRGRSIRDYMYHSWNAYIDFPPARDGAVGVPAYAMSLHVDYTPYVPE